MTEEKENLSYHEGVEEGNAESNKFAAIILLQDGMDINTVASMTHLSVNEIMKLATDHGLM